MGDFTFASNPSVSISRTKFNRTFSHNLSFNLGEIAIIGFDEVIPGSTHKIDLGSLVRMSTPIAPIMDDIQLDVFAFFCPMRLLWDHWKNFMGESENAGAPLTTYTIPQIDGFLGSVINTPADDLGLCPHENFSFVSGNKISVLPFRGVAKIYNRFFRNQNVESPIPVFTGDTVTNTELSYLLPGLRIYDSGQTPPYTTYGTSRLVAYKLPDYFTSSLPYAQKGDPVSIFGDLASAPVVTGSDHLSNLGSSSLGWAQLSDSTKVSSGGHLGTAGNGTTALDTVSLGSGSRQVIPTNLWADLSKSVNTTINDLRFAFQLQKALEKDALYGSRYWEVLRAHYAVTAPDASLQDPELLGACKFDINISQVLQTTGFTDPTNTKLGTPGANSVTAHKDHVFTASFVEHGYIYIMAVARQKHHTYSQGTNKLWFRKNRFDFYHPVFANLGAQKVLNKEIYWDNMGNAENVFGYQDAWNEYRFLPSFNSGYLNPARTGALDYWTLADDLNGTPTLGPSFLKESRANLTRALVTGVTGPDFIASFYINDTVVNPMPLYSIPGFADHH